jgi:hypothetical protein
MADWSDAAPAGGPALTYLVEALRPYLGGEGKRILVAGPHSLDVIAALSAYAEVTCLVRGHAEAEELSALGHKVLLGTLAKLPEGDRYDAVVALDGMRRLCSVEGPQFSWSESVQALRRTVRSGGALLLTVENELGVHRLVDRRPATAGQTDADWNPLGEYDDTRPGTPARLRDSLKADGLTLAWLASVWPALSAATLLADDSRLRYGPGGALSAAISSVVAGEYAAKPVLSDPRRLAAAAVRAGLGPELAPAWVALTFHGTAPTVGLPAAVLGGAPMPALPDGRLLEELLIGASLRHDLPELRRLLALWVAKQPAATADNLIVEGGDLTPLDGSRPAVDTAVALQRFADVLLSGGYDHPWPHAGDAGSLTALLLAAAGLDSTPVPVDHAPPARPDSLREHEERVRRLEEQLADAGERIRHTESELVKRDGELRKLRLQVDMFSGKVGFRIARLGARAARKAVRAAKFKDR